MALNGWRIRFIESAIDQAFGGTVAGLRMLELGDQIMRGADFPEETGKEYFANRGFEHVSVDHNGEHGAIALDLRRPEQFEEWHGAWDVITNSGTTEHVDPHERQYECFGIIHDCLRVGGVAVHMIPDVHERDERGWRVRHCQNYYSAAFFDLLAKECQYELLSNTVIEGLRCAAVKKPKDTPFMRDRSKLLAAIARRPFPVSFRVKSFLKRIGVGNVLGHLGLVKDGSWRGY